MKRKTIAIILATIGFFGAIGNSDWTTQAERWALIVCILFCFIAAGISFYDWKLETKSTSN